MKKKMKQLGFFLFCFVWVSPNANVFITENVTAVSMHAEGRARNTLFTVKD